MNTRNKTSQWMLRLTIFALMALSLSTFNINGLASGGGSLGTSPFDFAAQCVFGIPTDVPEPRDDESGHGTAVARILMELAHASDGGVFGLFTSHTALRRTADAIRHQLGGRWPLLVQGEGQRDHLLRRFRQQSRRIDEHQRGLKILHLKRAYDFLVGERPPL